MIEITGYVTATGRDSKVLNEGGKRFIEQICPGAFRRALDRAGNITLNVDHDSNKTIADTSSGTLELHEDNIGLRVKANIEDEETINLYNQNKMRGWSFEFIPTKMREDTRKDGMLMRYVSELDLFAVTIVSDKHEPAYSGTQIDERRTLVRSVILSDIPDSDIQDRVETEATTIPLEVYEKEIEILKLKGE